PEVIGNNTGGPMWEIEMCLGDRAINSSDDIQKLHAFRNTCLAADAAEAYTSTGTEGLKIHLPFTGDANAIAASLPAVQVCCQQAHKVTLDGHPLPGTVMAAPGLDALAPCESAEELTVKANGWPDDLPGYITANPEGLFPNVSSVVVCEGERGMETYAGGVSGVLSALSSLERATFELSVQAGDQPVLCMVPEGVSHLPAEGESITLQVKCRFAAQPAYGHFGFYHDEANMHQNVSVGWRVYGGEREAGRQVMQRRVSRLEVHVDTTRGDVLGGGGGKNSVEMHRVAKKKAGKGGNKRDKATKAD
ncbi:unnamed protein product, partial [Vitrella brassicaformis CCMP3155]